MWGGVRVVYGGVDLVTPKVRLDLSTVAKGCYGAPHLVIPRCSWGRGRVMKDLAAQRAKDETARKSRERVAQDAKEQRDREAALRDREKPAKPAQAENANGRSAKKEESKSSPGDERGADGVRVAILRVQKGTQIPDLEKALASSAVGAVADSKITRSGAARLEFLDPDAAHKLQDLIRGRKFIVNRQTC